MFSHIRRAASVLSAVALAAALDRAEAQTSAPPSADAVLAQMRKVADWQNRNLGPGAWDPDWTQAPFFMGLLAFHEVTREPQHLDIARRWSEDGGWKVRNVASKSWRNPDNRACTQVYIDIYLMNPVASNAFMIADVKSRMEEIYRTQQSGPQEWFAGDHVFMAAPVQPRLFLATHEQKHLTHLDQIYWSWSDNLFDKVDSLHYRDRGMMGRRTANGKKEFWGRGVGWSVGALTRVIPLLPETHPRRADYIRIFRGMMNTLRRLQDPEDGLWRSSLMDPEEFPQPETSGSGLFTYGMAWGINAGILPRETFLPSLIKAWNGMVWAVQPSGQLGWIQPPDVEPGPVPQTTSGKVYYGPGAFLLAGAEMVKLARGVSIAPRARPWMPAPGLPGSIPLAGIFDVSGRLVLRKNPSALILLPGGP